MQFASRLAQQRFDDLVADAAQAVVGLDFDGVLAPIIDEPDQAHIHPRGPETLIRLADVVKQVAVITGRPARQAVALGDLDTVGAEIAVHGRRLLVLGQYGNERWSSTDRRVLSPRPPRGLASFMLELPDLLKAKGYADAWVEEKGLAVAVHTRTLADPQASLEVLEPAVRDRAGRHGLVVEPGRYVVEVRAPGMDKGRAVRQLHRELRADAFMFIGDDLGDVEAFRAVMDLRTRGMLGLLVCSASAEQPVLRDLADVIVDGPDGVMELLDRFVTAAAEVTTGPAG
ncbi:MAG: trehalose-phosphatase [Nocardioidaceae bacterium]